MLVVDEKNNVTLTRGDSAKFTLTLTDSEGEAYDYSNDVVKFGVKRSAFDASCVLEKTVEDGVITLEPADTEGMEFGDYLYAVEVRHTVEAETEGEEDKAEVYTPIVARFSLGYNVL